MYGTIPHMPTQPNLPSQVNQSLSKVSSALNDVERSLRHARELLSQIEKESASPSFKDIPGIEGVFDGIYMVTKDGKKFEVPSNYAAKSLLIVGDGLKMINREGRNFFKQISKVKRKLEEGMMVKKDGKWHAITPSGSYRIVDSVIEYNKVSLNDKVLVQFPEDNPTAEFAALSKVLSAQAGITTKPASTINPVSPAPLKAKPRSEVVAKPLPVKPVVAKPLPEVKIAPKPPIKPVTSVTPSLNDDDLR